ncbi:hypothetical protein SLEP1_g24905 [Rubroshorea leprosula]|uniref:Uncharacterized protein n=1 Tax=Rubroshorea leprosula TaxID=152421 RepID=A0AAV5JRD0_9ROSI|nr:hypothetical protein SLEP1_g24905 [Rubroshorea leprosula]
MLLCSRRVSSRSVGDDTAGEAGNGEINQVEREMVEVTESKLKKAKYNITSSSRFTFDSKYIRSVAKD